MLAAMRGTVCGNTVIVEDDALSDFDGANVIITVLDKPKIHKKMTVAEINALIAKHGQPKLLVGDAGLETVRETLKNDVW